MEIKLNLGDKIEIPTGCKAIIEDNQIVIEEFKDSDILISKWDGHLVIFSNYKGYTKSIFDSYVNNSNSSNNGWITKNFRLATEEEKQQLFNKMKEQGLRWNAEEKGVEKIRWRAEDGKEYYYVGNRGILMVDTEDGHIDDENRYKFGNYFHTKEQAKEAAKRVNETLRKYHEEIGE